MHSVLQELLEEIQRKLDLSGSNGRRRSKGENRKVQWHIFWVLENADRGLIIRIRKICTSLS